MDSLLLSYPLEGLWPGRKLTEQLVIPARRVPHEHHHTQRAARPNQKPRRPARGRRVNQVMVKGNYGTHNDVGLLCV